MKENNKMTSTIDTATLYDKADAIAIRAILTDLIKSGNETMRKLYYSAVSFALSGHVDDDGNGGADIIQSVALYLWGYAGKSLDDETDDGQTDKNGNRISILRGAFRAIGAKIKGKRQRQYRNTYLTDYEKENGEICVPFEWDIDNYSDFVRIDEMIENLQLTNNQKQVLALRMRGLSLDKCGTAKGCSKQNIDKVLKQIREKYISVYGIPVTVNA